MHAPSPWRHHPFCSAAVMMLAAACVPDSPSKDTVTPNPTSPSDAGEVLTNDAGELLASDAGSAARDAGQTNNPRDAGEALDAGEIDAGTIDGGSSLCPPQGPFGTNQGMTFPSLTLRDCDGNVRELHDVCSTRASHLFIMAGW